MLWARARKRALSWGEIEAQVNGGRAAHGAISAVGAELLAPQIASILYGKSEADLTPDEKADVISMASLAGGIAGALMNGKSEGVEIIGNTAINAQIAENTVTNNYLSGWQEKQRDEEFAACNGSLRCELKTGVYWELVSAGQDTAYGAGLAASIPVGIFETVKGLAEIAVHPIDSLNAIKTLIQEGNFTEAMKQSYANRIDKMIVEYEKAGAEGAFKAGLETGQLLQETVGILTGGAGLAKVGAKFTKAAATFTKHQVHRVVNHTVLNRVINEVDNIAVSTDKGFINGTKVCGASCEIKATSKAEQALIDDIVKNGDIKGSKTETLINALAKRSGYELLQGGKYGSNNGFDHVLVGKDGSVVIIDSKQIKNNGSIQVSSKGAGDTNQLSEKWIKEVVYKLPENDPTRTAIIKAIDNDKSVKTIIAGVDKSNGKVVLLPVRVPNKK